jgi:apolipoprotein D and lipocalin family protein
MARDRVQFNTLQYQSRSSGPIGFVFSFSKNYSQVCLDQDYNRALTGQPSRDYLWILSREPRIDESLYERLVSAAKSLGFDTSKLVRTIN